MTRQVAFLRAANVGRRRVDMKTLAATLAGAGYADVTTYLNSGNAIFTAPGERAALEAAIEPLLDSAFGFELTTFLRTAAELTALAAAVPFGIAGGDTHFVTFLKTAASKNQAEAIENLSGDFDTLVVAGSEVHWRMRGRSSDSPLVKRDWERVLGPNSSTSRNLTMIRKLVPKLS